MIDVGHHARATVVLDHVGSGTFGAGVEVVVGDGADVTVVSLQDWADDAVHAGAHAGLVGRDAKYRHVVATLGGDLVRIVPTVVYSGSGGDAELYGLTFTDAGQHHEHRIFIDHKLPNCRSRVTYKSALQGENAHAVWIGDVLIRAEAVGTDTYELNRNLVLSDGARADSVPNLEIETGEVAGAGHASATGRFDDDALFYLMSRGITADVARRLVVRSFFAEVLAAIPVEEVRDRVAAAVDEELERYRTHRRSSARSAGGCSELDCGLQTVADLKDESALGVTIGEEPVCVAKSEGTRLRPSRRLLACRDRAVGGRGGGRHDRVLAARIPLRSGDRRAHRAACQPAGAHLRGEGRRRRRSSSICSSRPEPTLMTFVIDGLEQYA